MTVTDILDATFRLYRDNFLTFFGIATMLQIPFIVLYLLVTMFFGQGIPSDLVELAQMVPRFNLSEDSLTDLPIGNMVGYFGFVILISLFEAFFVVQIINGALTHAISQRYLDQPIGMLEAYSNLGSRRIGNLVLNGVIISLFSMIVSLLIVGGLFFSFVLMGTGFGQGSNSGFLLIASGFVGILVSLLIGLILLVLLGMTFLFAPQAIVLEDSNAWGAIRRSWQLVRSSFWRIMLILLVFWLLIQLVTIGPSYMLNLLLNVVFDPLNDFAIHQAMSLLISYFLQLLVLPLQLCAYTLLYYDLRVRKEGYDMQLMAQDPTPSMVS